MTETRESPSVSPGSSVPTVEDESLAGSLAPGLHARALRIVTEMLADAALEPAGADLVIAMDLRRGAQRVGIGLTRFRQEADAGRIRTFRSGRRRLVSERALHEYVTRLESECPREPSGSGLIGERGSAND